MNGSCHKFYDSMVSTWWFLRCTSHAPEKPIPGWRFDLPENMGWPEKMINKKYDTKNIHRIIESMVKFPPTSSNLRSFPEVCWNSPLMLRAMKTKPICQQTTKSIPCPLRFRKPICSSFRIPSRSLRSSLRNPNTSRPGPLENFYAPIMWHSLEIEHGNLQKQHGNSPCWMG